ncbi:MAG: lysophospholipid acyltransferase family protein [Burkholderiaceae bacterium]
MGFLVAPRRLAGVLARITQGLWLAGVRMPRLDADGRHAIVQRWSGQMLRTLGVEVRVSGAPQPGAVLFVANHISWLDIPTLHASAPRMRFVSKAAISRWPLLGALARAGGTLFIERERRRDALRVVREVADALRGSDAVTVFPEGTTGAGETVLPFHANLLQAAISTGSVVQPVVLRYSEPGQRFSAAAQFTGSTTLVASLLKVARARGMVAHVEFLQPEAPSDPDRRVLASRLRDRIADRLEADAVPG